MSFFQPVTTACTARSPSTYWLRRRNVEPQLRRARHLTSHADDVIRQCVDSGQNCTPHEAGFPGPSPALRGFYTYALFAKTAEAG
jgi:hypothetical protein